MAWKNSPYYIKKISQEKSKLQDIITITGSWASVNIRIKYVIKNYYDVLERAQTNLDHYFLTQLFVLYLYLKLF